MCFLRLRKRFRIADYAATCGVEDFDLIKYPVHIRTEGIEKLEIEHKQLRLHLTRPDILARWDIQNIRRPNRFGFDIW